MDRMNPEIISEVEQILERNLSQAGMQDFAQSGGIEAVVQVLNGVDRTTERTILDTLEIQDPELAEEIKKRMFVFEDIVTLEVQMLDIARHLFVAGRVAKAQITVTLIELEQVLGDAITVARAQRANRYQGRRATLCALGPAHIPQPAGAGLPGRFQPVFGDIHGLEYR